jgi:hypothetical protein
VKELSSARYRTDEQGLVQLRRRSARSPRRVLGTATTVTSCPTTVSRREAGDTGINSAALRFVPYEDRQAEGYGVYRQLLNQARETKGAKR